MSLLDSDTAPHKCTIRRRVAAASQRDELGSVRATQTDDQTEVPCWEQPVSANEITAFAKRGMTINRKVYFYENPNVTSRHEILITERDGEAVSDPVPMDVMGTDPDCTVGLGLLYKVMCNVQTGRFE